MSRSRRPHYVWREVNQRGLIILLHRLKVAIKPYTAPQFTSLDVHQILPSISEIENLHQTLQHLDNHDFNNNTSNLQITDSNITILKENITNLTTNVSELIEQLKNYYENTAHPLGEQSNFAFQPPLQEKNDNLPGRKKIGITREQIKHLRSLNFSWKKIAQLLNISLSTLKRRKNELFLLSDRPNEFSDITEERLDRIYQELCSVIPNMGRRRFIGALRARGLKIQRDRVMDYIRRVDPLGTSLRWRTVIPRRKYYVPMPNSLWHIDSSHKLVQFKLVCHVCIDGKSRLLLYVHICNNNRADTVLSLFKNAVKKWGLPSRVRSDHGMENYFVAKFMLKNRGGSRGSIITGSSVHNSRVERIHRDIYSSVLCFYSVIFNQLMDDNLLNTLSDLQLHCLHYVYIPRIQNSLNELVDQLNNRPMSTEQNLSPRQLWEKGMIENVNADATVFQQPIELSDEDYGNISEEEYQVPVGMPDLPNPMTDDGNNGKNLYCICVQILKTYYQHQDNTFTLVC